MTGPRPYRLSRSRRRVRTFGSLFLLPAALSADSGVARLDISVTGISELAGALAIAIFDSAEKFDARSDPVGQARIPISTDAVTWSIELAAPATYAVIVYQDLNGNGEIDMGRLGRPKEPYGFSNNARGRFGPPGFQEVAFNFEQDGLWMAIEVD